MAESAAKASLKREEIYLQEGERGGWIKLHSRYSMRAIGTPDRRFQARVNPLDLDHVHRLDLILQRLGDLYPIVVFRAMRGKEARHIVADGFHRCEVYCRAGRDAIPAYIVDVPWERIEHEARLYAAMCNQLATLVRTPADIRKAIEILCADPECDSWTNTQLADHCGSTAPTVKKVRMEYAIRHKKDLPAALVEEPRPAAGAKAAPRPRPKFDPHAGAPKLPASVFPMVPKPEPPPGPEHEPDVDARPPLGSTRHFKDWLLKKGVLVEAPPVVARALGLSGYLTGRRAIVLCASAAAEDVYAAIGRVTVLRQVCARDGIPTVVLPDAVGGTARKVCEAATGCGYQFATATELAEVLKAEAE